MKQRQGLILFLSLCLLLVLSTARCRPEAKEPIATTVNTDWGRNTLWDDGLAEVAKYQARRVIYGKSRTFESVFITVKEDFTRKYYVKSDTPRSDSSHLPVFKLNMVSSIPTENYPYQYLTSVFVSREAPMKLLKLTNGSQEWCGNTFKLVRGWETPAQLVFHSYFDGQGDGSVAIELKTGDLLEDQLPLSLRSLPFKTGLQLKLRILESLISNRVGPLRVAPGEISVVDQEEVNGLTCWRVTVSREGLTQTYWFSWDYPNIMTKWTSSDGREFLLKETVRRKYWD